jgi:hypothetical protein
MKSMRSLIGIVLAFALVAFAGPSDAKSYYAELVKLVDGVEVPVQLVPNGTGVEIRIKVVNTSPEPATINSLAICNVPGVTNLVLVGPGRLVPYTGSDPNCGTLGGQAVVDFRGIRRGGASTTFVFRADVNSTCSLTSSTWTIAASTGNAFSSLDKFTPDRLMTAYFGCDGELACGVAPVLNVNTFDGSNGAADDTVSGFFAGWRAPNWKPPYTCTRVAYKTYNNINGDGSTLTDSFNTSVPPNFAVINYSGSETNGVLLAHTITFAVEPSDSNGLPDSTKLTYYCVTGTDCGITNANDRKVAQGCSSPAISHLSIPTGEPGCIRGANWVIVPATDDRCTLVNTATPRAPACIQWAIDFLEKDDPPWGRTS